MIRTTLSIIGGVLLIVFGLLFLIYLPTTGTELATDAIFVGAGILVIRNAYLSRRKQKQAQLSNATAGKKTGASKQKPNQGRTKKDAGK